MCKSKGFTKPEGEVKASDGGSWKHLSDPFRGFALWRLLCRGSVVHVGLMGISTTDISQVPGSSLSHSRVTFEHRGACML